MTYWDLLAPAFIVKAEKGVILIMLMMALILITTATSPMRFVNYGQNIAFLAIEKLPRF